MTNDIIRRSRPQLDGLDNQQYNQFKNFFYLNDFYCFFLTLKKKLKFFSKRVLKMEGV
jgi:hypothetical protein